MRDITLKITGKQCYDGKEEDQMEFVTDGKVFLKGDNIFVIYDESPFSGFEGCKTTIKMTEDSLKMRRIGATGFNTELYFEKGKRFSSVYETPYGPMGLEVLTNYVKYDMDKENLKGSVDIEYDISLEGMAEGKNHLKIDVM